MVEVVEYRAAQHTEPIQQGPLLERLQLEVIRRPVGIAWCFDKSRPATHRWRPPRPP